MKRPHNPRSFLTCVIAALLFCIPMLTSTAQAASLSELPEFMFSSGAGAWDTTLTIRPDGTFEGEFHDTDIDGGDTYNATTRICQFSGKFTDIKQIDPYTFSMRVGSLETAHGKGEEWIEDMIRYVASDPYGLPDIGGEVLLYLPGHDTSTLPEEFLDWYRMPNAISALPEKLPCFGLYNVSEQLGFSSSDEESAKVLPHWNLPTDSSASTLPLAAYTELQDFLVQLCEGWMYCGWTGQTYDFRDIAAGNADIFGERTILQTLTGDAISYAGPVPGEYEPYRETNWFEGDPLEKWDSHHKANAAAVSWILQNVFNCSEEYTLKLHSSLSQSFGEEYYFDGYYYSQVTGIGGPSPNAIITDIRQYEKYYFITYELRFDDFYGGERVGRFFSVVERKTLENQDYWSLYYHRKLADGEILNLPTSTGTTPSVPAGSFSDVAQNAYYYNAVRWGVEQGIVAGTSANKFSPNDTCTKAQVLTFLWRLDGSPESAISNPFSNVTAKDYFYEPVLWAHEMGLISGTAFDASTPCTRSMAVTYLWQLVGSPAAGSSGFTDVSDSADYAQAVAWAVNHGITSGTGNNRFSPDSTCTRAQIITFLYRTEYPA